MSHRIMLACMHLRLLRHIWQILINIAQSSEQNLLYYFPLTAVHFENDSRYKLWEYLQSVCQVNTLDR
jgi:hypothetical protein